MNIEGHAAIVTGGASGLGEATARELARLGAKVALFDVNLALAQQVAADIGAERAIACTCDITNTDSVAAALAQAAAAHGPARILMNIAGIGSAKRVVQKDGSAAPLEDFAKVINVNLIGSYNISRLFAAACARLEPLVDGERGVMMFTASVAAFDGQVGQQAYSASKGGLVGMTLPMARDLAQHGIRVCTVAPGLFATADETAARTGAAVAGGLHSFSVAPGKTRRVCPARMPYRDQQSSQRRGDPAGRRLAHGAQVSPNVLHAICAPGHRIAPAPHFPRFPCPFPQPKKETS